MTRFLANENIYLPSVYLLRAHGHDVISVKEEAPGLDDVSILAWARAAGRIILTSDHDYGDLIYRDRLPPPQGIVLVRFIPGDRAEIGRRVLDVLDRQGLTLEGMITILGRDRVRQSPLPPWLPR